ncbi:hypothetical protein HGP14_01210 [Rhizobium sp. P32RR-XVIII]|uniref:hypothetical protein n=1 Tax=Rhizobium sp. P32RR-XVIII TaxID=2726738 RepID=UPI001456E3CA|nr:hypothetical protein [Rhizobium sp. P32RR-XVIII]NLS01988.1 hypothetical protein [Rhizobium sp. P32RR-XVIII]
MARAPFDYDLHIQGVDNAIDRETFEAETPALKVRRSTTKSTDKRRRDNAQRAGQGDRTDWKLHLYVDPQRGFRLVPDAQLSVAKKLARAKSLKAAATRRTRIRDERGVVLNPRPTDGDAAWRSELALSSGIRWDFTLHFSDHDDKEAAGLDYLFRYGTARPDTSDAHRLTRQRTYRPLGWYSK